jgi:adenine deaminase
MIIQNILNALSSILLGGSTMNHLNLLKFSRSEEKSNLVLKHCQMINVYTGEIETTDIAIHDGIIVGIGQYEGIHELDLSGLYVAPGLIDAHVHIESSMLTPQRFAQMVIPKGTTTIIADPHEISNVCGVAGIEYMLNSSIQTPLSVYMMVPSSVPATVHEHSGASISVADIRQLKNHPRILGLGEVMDYPSVISGQPEIHEKIKAMNHLLIDGHAPDIMGKDLNAYILSGIMTDHECTHHESMVERIRRGMYVHLREGSATRNMTDLLKGVTKENMSRLMFCTDDKHPLDILNEGHINYNVNLAIRHGIDPIDAIRMATLNPATCYHLHDLGGIAPGKRADLIVFKSLEDIDPIMVIKDGLLVSEHGHALFDAKPLVNASVQNSVHLQTTNISFDLFVNANPVRVIELVRHNITTLQKNANINIKDGKFVHDETEDILKIASIERHHHTGLVGLGLVHGFGFKNGALAMTIAHDSHNIVVVGSSDLDMQKAVHRILELQGGIVVTSHGKVVAELGLEVGGLMTNHDAHYVSEKIRHMKNVLISMGLNPSVDDPFIALSFLCLPVIPKLKLTDRGLFDVEIMDWVKIEI